jgi:hypothetical protein
MVYKKKLGFFQPCLVGGQGHHEEVIALLGVAHVHQLVIHQQAGRHRPVQRGTIKKI